LFFLTSFFIFSSQQEAGNLKKVDEVGKALINLAVPKPCGAFMKVNVGDKAPDFTLDSQTGENVTLSDFFGKKNVVLYFYPKDETPGCTREACTFRDSYELFTDLGAEVIGVSADTVESHKAFAEHHNLPFTLLSDLDNNVRKLYGATSTLGFIPGRVTFIIDKKGVVRHVFSSQLQPEKHIEEAKEVLKRINEEEKAKPQSRPL
jgi:peroxiredoxin Q/BCP